MLGTVVRLLPYALPVRPADVAQQSHSLTFTDRSGAPLGTVLSQDQEHTVAVGLPAVAPSFLEAIVAAEDARFYERGPVDALALGRAVLQAVREGHVVSGGSTIPMQLARMLYGLPSTPMGKAEQIWCAWRIAAGMDRPQILDAYVNRLPMGGNVYGVEAAAQTYFGVPAARLDLAQSALLAALPNDPTGLDPDTHLRALEDRQHYVLQRMVATGAIDRATAQRAADEQLALAPRGRGFVAAEHLQFQLAAAAPPGSARVRTTIDLGLQTFVEEQVRQVMRGLRGRNVHDAAVLVVDNATGDVLSYVGSPDYFDDAVGGRNDGVQALRQPGSALKPFLYEYALETRAIRPSTILADEPVHYSLPGDLLYSPSDYAGTYAGPVRVRIALADSLNVPAVRVLEQVGVPEFLDRLRALGFTKLDKPADYYGLGLTLGGGEVSLWELTRAYATMARQGRPLHLVTMLDQPRAPDEDGIGWPSEWNLVTDILADDHARARAFGVRSALSLPFPAAVKTGTSSDFRDTWTVGYTTDYTVGVWVGNFDGAPMQRVSGVAGAAPLWNRIMLHLYETREPSALAPPYGLTLRPICSTTGWRPASDCKTVVQEYFFPEDVARYDAGDAQVVADARSGLEAKAISMAREASAFRITQPADGAYYLLKPDARRQRLAFTAEGAQSTPVSWKLDGRLLGSSDRRSEIFWELTAGPHVLVARQGAQSDAVRFTVARGAPDAIAPGFVTSAQH